VITNMYVVQRLYSFSLLIQHIFGVVIFP